MSDSGPHCAVLFRSVNHVMWADRLLSKSKIPHKLIPVPRHLSSDCGVCIRIKPDVMENVQSALKDIAVEWEIRPL